MPGPPIALQINCGFARVAIKELTPSNRRDLNACVRTKQFRELFCMSSYKITGELFQLDNKGRQPFDRKCDMILDNLKSKWHPTEKRMEYTSTFSIQNWKSLSHAQQAMHTLANCEGCYHAYKELQAAFPGKPMFIAQPQIVELPETPSTSRKDEKVLARRVLCELNSTWEEKFNHTFSIALPQNVPEANLCAKKSRTEKKREDRIQKRQLTQHISDQLKENLTMSVLAEGESLSSYNRKRLALSFESATQPKRKKSHSPNELNLTWDVDGAIDELQSLPEGETINWSAIARKYNATQKNGGQILKGIAEKRGIDVSKLDGKVATQRSRRCKKRLPGGQLHVYQPQLKLWLRNTN